METTIVKKTTEKLNGTFTETGSDYEYEYTLKDGKLDGKYTIFFKNGQPAATRYYKNGVLDGEFRVYHENGQLAVKCTYANGKEEGEHLHYSENGRLEARGEYKNGKLNGVSIFFGEGGDVSINIFKNGKHVRKIVDNREA